MSVNQWVLKFRDLHERFRAGKLDDIDRRAYFADREQFAKALLNAQGLSMEAGQSARRSFRIAQGMQMDLSFNTGNVRCMTLDISCGGFSVMMHQPPPEQEQPGFNLRMPGGADQSFLGHCSIQHYELVLTTDSGHQVKIQPSYIVSVTGENGATARASQSSASFVGVGRIYKGKMVHGCTGSPGFLPDTIEHAGAPCQVHESTVPRTATSRRA